MFKKHRPNCCCERGILTLYFRSMGPSLGEDPDWSFPEVGTGSGFLLLGTGLRPVIVWVT